MANPKESPKQSSRAGRASGLHVRGPGEGDLGAEGSLTADWQRRVVGRSLRSATKKSIDRGSGLIAAAATLLERCGGDGFTVQDVADEAGQSLRTLYLYFESKDDLLLAVFEEAIKNYATVVREAIADLDDELDRLAGGILTAARYRNSRGRASTSVSYACAYDSVRPSPSWWANRSGRCCCSSPS